jgi:hypothetical protein
MSNQNDFFKNLAKQKSEEAKVEEANRSNYQSFDNVEWTGFKGSPEGKVIRFTDDFFARKMDDFTDKSMIAPDGTHVLNKYSGRVINAVRILGDGGKFFWAIVPSKEEDPNHIYWRLMDTVLKRDWIDDPKGATNSDGTVKKVPVYVHEEAYKKLVGYFKNNGFDFNGSKNQYDKGWKVREGFVANVIDRIAIDRHRELQKTLVLSKSITVDEEKNRMYVNDYGIPSFGFVKPLFDLMGSYGQPNTFDMYIERTGEREMPWKIKNASRVIDEVPEFYHEFVSTDSGLTDEELSWERYDLDARFGVTSYLKWFKRAKVLIKEVDTSFKSYFFDELEEKAEKDKAEFDKKKKEETTSGATTGFTSEQTAEPTPEPSPEPEPAPAERRRRGATEEAVEPDTWSTLASHGFKGEMFYESNKPFIKSVDSTGNVTWETSKDIVGCTNATCDFETPEEPSIEGCLYCGAKF